MAALRDRWGVPAHVAPGLPARYVDALMREAERVDARQRATQPSPDGFAIEP